MKMTIEQKLEVFESVLDKFKDPDIRHIVIGIIKETPTIFFGTSVSSSGKYHPKETNGLMGLAKHSIAVMLTAEELLSNKTVVKSMGLDELSEKRKEIILAAALLHDTAKYGSEEHDMSSDNKVWTRGDHPMLVKELAEKAGLLSIENEDLKYKLYSILSLVKTHMGQWNKYRDKNGNYKSMPTPETPEQALVHLADYTVSRKTLDIVGELSLPETVNNRTIDWFDKQNNTKK